MTDFSSLLNNVAPFINFNDEEKQLFISVLRVKNVERKQYLGEPGYVSKCRSYVVNGALRSFFIGHKEQEHTISLAIDDSWIGDHGSFVSQEPATLFIEAIEDSTVIQWTYESEQMLLKRIPQYAMLMMQRSQQIAVMLQHRLISNLTLSAEERYSEFARQHPEMVLRLPIYIIASYLGMPRELLSRIRGNQRPNTKKLI